ncbi:MAG: cysteine rich repeat-containing protein [Gammaproteobacteria bacterium]|nr:cysteine rich repeat-containing protein [Gammaproteobacteria bacterium]
MSVSGTWKLAMDLGLTRGRLLLTALILLPLAAVAQEQGGKPLAEKLKNAEITISSSVEGCGDDVKQFCPGLGDNSDRVFMCLAAYEHMLSAQCKQGVLEARLAINTGIAAVQYSISACEADADRHCLDVKPGEGRLLQCLKENESGISAQCTTALKDTGLWDRVP